MKNTINPFKSIALSKAIILYYSILLAIVVFRTSEDAPNIVVRLGFLVAFFIPFISKWQILFPACLISFMTVGTYGFAYNFFPYEMYLYVVISVIGIIFSGKRCYYKSSWILLLFLLISVCVNVINSFTITNFDFSLATTMLFVVYLGKDKEINSLLLLNAFCIASLSLSAIFLLNYERFLTTYNEMDDMVRSGWTDPNYLSCIIGMGVLTALYQLLDSKQGNLLLKAFWCTTIVTSFMSQVLLASRGGLLAVGISSIVLIYMTKVKIVYKVLMTLMILAFIVWLYNNSYFELLAYRVEQDDGSGSGRMDIWYDKLDGFMQFNPLEMIFGVGSERSFMLGVSGGSGVGFHNDYLAMLCAYGVYGLCVFLYLLYYPIKVTDRKYRFTTIAFIAYLALTCATLEPFTAGRLTYFGFFLMVLVFANLHSKKDTMNLC